jgi:hypothetical protein
MALGLQLLALVVIAWRRVGRVPISLKEPANQNHPTASAPQKPSARGRGCAGMLGIWILLQFVSGVGEVARTEQTGADRDVHRRLVPRPPATPTLTNASIPAL